MLAVITGSGFPEVPGRRDAEVGLPSNRAAGRADLATLEHVTEVLEAMRAAPSALIGQAGRTWTRAS